MGAGRAGCQSLLCPARTVIAHEGHLGLVHEGQLLCFKGGGPEPCALAQHAAHAAENSCQFVSLKDHVHGPDCGHEKVPHGDHWDYLVEGRLHHVIAAVDSLHEPKCCMRRCLGQVLATQVVDHGEVVVLRQGDPSACHGACSSAHSATHTPTPSAVASTGPHLAAYKAATRQEHKACCGSAPEACDGEIKQHGCCSTKQASTAAAAAAATTTAVNEGKQHASCSKQHAGVQSACCSGKQQAEEPGASHQHGASCCGSKQQACCGSKQRAGEPSASQECSDSCCSSKQQGCCVAKQQADKPAAAHQHGADCCSSKQQACCTSKPHTNVPTTSHHHSSSSCCSSKQTACGTAKQDMDHGTACQEHSTGCSSKPHADQPAEGHIHRAGCCSNKQQTAPASGRKEHGCCSGKSQTAAAVACKQPSCCTSGKPGACGSTAGHQAINVQPHNTPQLGCNAGGCGAEHTHSIHALSVKDGGAGTTHTNRHGVSSSGDKGLTTTRILCGGICCPAEVGIINTILQPLAGVTSVEVHVVSKCVVVQHDAAATPPAVLVATLNAAHMDATLRSPGQQAQVAERARPPLLVILCGLLTLVSLVSYGHHPAWLHQFKWVALPAVAVGIPPVLVKAWVSLTKWRLDINVLMTVAVAGAIGLGDYAEAAGIVFLFSLAEWLEGRCMSRARAAIGEVLQLQPTTALLLPPDCQGPVDHSCSDTHVPAPDGQVDGQQLQAAKAVPLEDVAVGSRVVVRPGDAIPLDGHVVLGASAADESMLTGEARLVAKRLGDEVFGGTLNMGNGTLVVRTSAVAADSTVARLGSLMEEAAGQRSNRDRLVDTFARWYTPAVVVAAALVALIPSLVHMDEYQHWLYLALVLLVTACPCALVISTPVASVCGLARAARQGVIVKGALHLERLGGVSAITFDKSGTLTQGHFQVVHAGLLQPHDVISTPDLRSHTADAHVDHHATDTKAADVAHVPCVECAPPSAGALKDMLALAAALEAHSLHPMAPAIIGYAAAQGVDTRLRADHVLSAPGLGLLGVVSGREVVVGSARLAANMLRANKAKHAAHTGSHSSSAQLSSSSAASSSSCAGHDHVLISATPAADIQQGSACTVTKEAAAAACAESATCTTAPLLTAAQVPTAAAAVTVAAGHGHAPTVAWEAAAIDAAAAEWGVRGASVSFVVVDGQLVGVLAVRDEPRLHAREAVEQLRAEGVTCAMLTGDLSATAHVVAKQVSLDPQHVHAQLLPADKLALVQQYKQNPQHRESKLGKPRKQREISKQRCCEHHKCCGTKGKQDDARVDEQHRHCEGPGCGAQEAHVALRIELGDSDKHNGSALGHGGRGCVHSSGSRHTHCGGKALSSSQPEHCHTACMHSSEPKHSHGADGTDSSCSGAGVGGGHAHGSNEGQVHSHGGCSHSSNGCCTGKESAVRGADAAGADSVAPVRTQLVGSSRSTGQRSHHCHSDRCCDTTEHGHGAHGSKQGSCTKAASLLSWRGSNSRPVLLAHVGDGINDAPALAAADVGVAMGTTAAAITVAAGDVVLFTSDLRALSFARGLGRRVTMVIMANITFALVTKIAVLVLSFVGYASLWMAVLVDVGSALLVVLHALTVLRYRNQLKPARNNGRIQGGGADGGSSGTGSSWVNGAEHKCVARAYHAQYKPASTLPAGGCTTAGQRQDCTTTQACCATQAAIQPEAAACSKGCCKRATGLHAGHAQQAACAVTGTACSSKACCGTPATAGAGAKQAC